VDEIVVPPLVLYDGSSRDDAGSGNNTSLGDGPDRNRESLVLDLLEAEYGDLAQAAYLTNRFGYRLVLAHHYARMARVYFFAARIAVIGSGALLPAIVTLQSQSHGAVHTWTTVCAIVLSVLIAIAADLFQASRMDQRWKLHHWTWSELRKEGWALAERRGPYTDKATVARFTIFVDRTETVLHKFDSVLLTLTGDRSDEPRMNLSSHPENNVAQVP
jgi:uncharacterized protein DUF4231